MTKAAELAKMGEVLTNSQIGGRRNIIINGSAIVSQRSTSTASLSSGNNFVLDRTRFQLTNGGTWTMSQSTTVPTGQGFSHSLKLDCTTADTSLGSTDYLLVQQLIEGQDVQQFAFGTSDAKSVTVSFWIRSNKTGTYTLEVQQQNSSNGFYQNAKTFTISSANTWEKKEITFVGNTSQNIINSNAVGFYVTIWLGTGTSRTSGTFTNGTWHNTTANRISSSNVNLADSTDNELYLTGLQMEVGEQATPFEHRSFGEELGLCQRYYQQFSGDPEAYAGTEADAESCGAGVWYGSSQILGMLAYKAPMRTAPSISFVEAGTTTATGDWSTWYGYQVGKTSNDTSPVDVITSDNARFNFDTSASGSTNGGGAYGLVRDGKQIKIDAEL